MIGTAGVGRETFRVPEDDGQQVVEIVGHAAGELPDGVHLLRLTQFPFERLAFGDIDRDGEQTIPAPVPRPADLMAHVQPMDAPVGPENPELRRTINAGRHRRLARHSERFAVVGVDQLVVRLHRAVKRAVRHAVHGGHRLRPRHASGAHLNLTDADSGGCMREAGSFVGRAQLCFNALAIGDVSGDAAELHLAMVGPREGQLRHRDRAPVAAHVGRFAAPQPIPQHRRQNHLVQRRQRLRGPEDREIRDRLLRPDPQHRASRLVDVTEVEHAAFEYRDAHHVGRGFDDRREPRLRRLDALTLDGRRHGVRDVRDRLHCVIGKRRSAEHRNDADEALADDEGISDEAHDMVRRGPRLVESRIAGDGARHDDAFAGNVTEVEEHGRPRAIRAVP